MNTLFQQASGLIPEIKRRSKEIDDNRFLPQELAGRLAEMGFYRMYSPVGLGGLGVSPRAACEVIEELATGSGSVAWCVYICATSHLHIAALRAETRDKIAAQPCAIVSSVFAPSGTALRQQRDGQDGYLINGHWKWGSSSRNAHWICGGVTEVYADGSPVAENEAVNRAVFLPEDIEFVDNWHVSGLRGTGSGDYKAENVWLPADRLGSARREASFEHEAVYRFPRFGILATPCGAIAIGMAQACIDEVIRVAKEKTPQGSRRTIAQRPVFHKDLAVYQTELRAARALFYETIDGVWEKVQSEPADLNDRLALRTANVHAMNSAVRVIDRMYSIVGGSSVYESSCLQRHFRDVHVASQHMMVSDSVMELAGRVLVGLDSDAPGL